MQPFYGFTASDQQKKPALPIRRNWVTPFTFGAFMLSAVTGILLFFNVHTGLVKPAHEWLSWLMVMAAVVHLARNHRSFVVSLKWPVGKTVVALFFLLLGACLLPLNSDPAGGHQRRHHADKITEALAHAPLSTVAKVANREPEETIELLWSRGINAQSTGQSIEEIAKNNSQQTMDLLAIIFQG